MQEFIPIEKGAELLEAATGAKTLFYGALGTNTVWGFDPPDGLPGVAITNPQIQGQVVVNIDRLRELVALLGETSGF